MLLLIGSRRLEWLAIVRAHWRRGRKLQKGPAWSNRAQNWLTLGDCFGSQIVCGEEEAAVSASQRARWRAGGGVRQRSAPLPMVCNCDRSIVANGLYPHTPDHHCAKQSTSARLPCATVRKSLPLRIAYLPTRVAWSKGCGRRGKQAKFHTRKWQAQHFDLGQKPLNLCSPSCRSGACSAA